MRIPSAEARQALSGAVRQRREDLRLRQEDVTARGGPSKAWLFNVENGVGGNYSETAVERLERALLWEPGSVAAIVKGGEPTPAAAATDPGSLVDPLTVEYRGFRFTIAATAGESAVDVARAQQSVVEAVMSRLRELDMIGDGSPPAAAPVAQPPD